MRRPLSPSTEARGGCFSWSRSCRAREYQAESVELLDHFVGLPLAQVARDEIHLLAGANIGNKNPLPAGDAVMKFDALGRRVFDDELHGLAPQLRAYDFEFHDGRHKGFPRGSPAAEVLPPRLAVLSGS